VKTNTTKRWRVELLAGQWIVREGSRRFFTVAGLSEQDATLVAQRLNILERLVKIAWEA